MDDYRNKCHLCQKQYNCRNALHTHQINQHFADAVPCVQCDKKFINVSVLGEHMIAHANNVHSCSVCGFLCKERFDLYIHVTTTHKSRYHLKCDLCAEVFASRRYLSEHFVRRHPEQFVSLALQMEVFCNMHSPWKYPELIKWPESGLQFAIPKTIAEIAGKSTPVPGAAQKIRVVHSSKGSSSSMPQALPPMPFLEPQQIIANADHRKSTQTDLKIEEQLLERTEPYDKEVPFKCVVCGMKFKKEEDFHTAHYMSEELFTPS